jgi:hypothetical protein
MAIGINSVMNYSQQQILQHTLDTHIEINVIRLLVIASLVTVFCIRPAASLQTEFLDCIWCSDPAYPHCLLMFVERKRSGR